MCLSATPFYYHSINPRACWYSPAANVLQLFAFVCFYMLVPIYSDLCVKALTFHRNFYLNDWAPLLELYWRRACRIIPYFGGRMIGDILALSCLSHLDETWPCLPEIALCFFCLAIILKSSNIWSFFSWEYPHTAVKWALSAFLSFLIDGLELSQQISLLSCFSKSDYGWSTNGASCFQTVFGSRSQSKYSSLLLCLFLCFIILHGWKCLRWVMRFGLS